MLVAHLKTQIKNFISSHWTIFIIRLGFFIRGSVYILVGLSVFNQMQSKTEIINNIHDLTYGWVLLILIIIGYYGYSLWGIARLTLPNVQIGKRIGYFVSAVSYFIFASSTLIFIVKHQRVEKSYISYVSEFIHTYKWSVVVLFIIGVASIIGSLYQIKSAFIADSVDDFWGISNLNKTKPLQKSFIVAAKIGTIIRGILFVVVGISVCIASYKVNVAEIKDYKEIVDIIKHTYGGSMWVWVVSGGLCLFGIYSILLALFVDLFPIQRYEKK